MFGSNAWGRVLGRLARVPVIVAHEHWSSMPRHEIAIDRHLYRLSDRILVASMASKRVVMEAEGIPSRWITPVYNGVDTREFAPVGDRREARRQLGLPEEGVLVGTLGRLTPDKGGQDDLLHGMLGLVSAGCDARLLIVGDGPLRAGLEQLSRDLGLEERVIFTGQRSGPDVPRLLGAMDIFVLPSHREALPIALLEAMSMGLPVVATRVGGIPEIVKDNSNGLLVAPGSPSSIQDALLTLAMDPVLPERLGKAARAHVEAEFTLETMTRRVERIYEELAEQKMKPRRASRAWAGQIPGAGRRQSRARALRQVHRHEGIASRLKVGLAAVAMAGGLLLGAAASLRRGHEPAPGRSDRPVRPPRYLPLARLGDACLPGSRVRGPVEHPCPVSWHAPSCALQVS